ncbi:hypothetical protein NL676_001303 [Syzygium grande]|nr:hypothetical protein NL676_001303 [Syzygium grande]
MSLLLHRQSLSKSKKLPGSSPSAKRALSFQKEVRTTCQNAPRNSRGNIHARDESRAIGGFWTQLKGWDPLTGSSFLLKYRIPTPMLQSFLLTKVTRKAGVFSAPPGHMFLAMNKTMSNTPNDWMQFYQQDFLSQVAPSGRVATASEAVSSDRSPPEGATAGASASSVAAALSVATPGHHATAAGLGNLGPSGHLSPEGGVAKPVRRRSRASRRTPTTVMNTDTTNFRALVQQFTGGPSAPFGSGHGPGGVLNFNIGLGPGQAGVGRPGGMGPSGFHVQYQVQQQPHHQQQLFQQHQNQQYMLSLNTSSPADLSLQRQRLVSSRSSGGGAASDGFGMEGVPSHQVSSRPPSSSSDDNNRSNDYIF